MIDISYVGNNISKMKIELHIPHEKIFSFLSKRGYEVKNWLWSFTDETFPNGITYHETWTFTATKPGEMQSEETIFTKVFEKELNHTIKELK